MCRFWQYGCWNAKQKKRRKIRFFFGNVPTKKKDYDIPLCQKVLKSPKIVRFPQIENYRFDFYLRIFKRAIFETAWKKNCGLNNYKLPWSNHSIILQFLFFFFAHNVGFFVLGHDFDSQLFSFSLCNLNFFFKVLCEWAKLK